MQTATQPQAVQHFSPSAGQQINLQPKRKPSGGWLGIICLGVLLILGIAALIGIAGFYQTNLVIMPGVTFRGINLGGMTQSSAALAIDQAWNQGRAFQMTDGSITWQTNAGFLGLWLDPNSIARSAYQANRTGQLLDEFINRVWINPVELQPVVVYNPKTAQQNLEKWSQLIDRPAKDALLTFTEGRVTITPAESGSRLDIPRTVAELSHNPEEAFFSGMVNVYFLTVEPNVVDLSTVEEQIKALQNLSLGGSIFDPINGETLHWQITQSDLNHWIHVEKAPNGSYQVELDHSQLVDYLASITDHIDLGEGRQLPSVEDPQALAEQILAGTQPVMIARHAPEEFITKEVESMLSVAWQVGIPMWRLIQVNPTLNQKYIPAGTTVHLPSKDDLLPLPVVINKRIIINITEQRMWIYQDGERIHDFVISTGIPDSPTQPGVYQVQTHEINAYADSWNLWMPHWLGIYEAWPGFMNGIHGLPMLSNGIRLWKNVLGRPASYGCIILDLPEAEWVYNWAQNGVVVEIQP